MTLLRRAVVLTLVSILAAIAGWPAQQSSSTQAKAAALPNDVYADSLSRLPLVKRDNLDDLGKKVYDAIVSGPHGSAAELKGPAGIWLYSPHVAENLQPMNHFLRFESDLGRRLAELTILAVARELENQFEWTNHEPVALKEGLEPSIIDIVRNRKSAQGLGEKEAVIITVVREAFDHPTISSQTFARAEKAFGRRGVIQLSATIQDTTWSSSFVRSFDIHLRPDQKPLLMPCCDRPPSAPRKVVALAEDAPLPADIDEDSRYRWKLMDRETLDERAKKAYDQVVNPATGTKSGLRGPAGLWIYSPEIAEHMRPLNNFLRYQTGFDLRLTEIAIMAIARETNAVFEFTAHETIGLKAGVEPQIIDIIKQRKSVAGLGEKEATIISFTRELAREKIVSSATFAQARRLFGDRDLVNLAAVTGGYASTTMVIRIFDFHLLADQKPLLPLP